MRIRRPKDIPQQAYDLARKTHPEWWSQARFISSDSEAEHYVNGRVRELLRPKGPKT